MSTGSRGGRRWRTTFAASRTFASVTGTRPPTADSELSFSIPTWAACGPVLAGTDRLVQRLLEQWDADDSIRGSLVVLHHPPFTNSRVTSDTLHVQRDFVPVFSRSVKTLAMISGHVHNYERYVRDGKCFLVAGGGGGPRAALWEGARRRHADELFAGGAVRAFHYLRFTPAKDALEVEVRGLEKDGTGFDTMEHFDLRWPEQAAR